MSLHPLTADLEHADAEQIGDAVGAVVCAAEKVHIEKLIKICDKRTLGVVKTNGWPLSYYYDLLLKVKNSEMPHRLCSDIMEQSTGLVSCCYTASFAINGHASWRYFMMVRFAWTSANMLIRDPGILCYADPTFALYQLCASEGSILERMNNYRG